MNKKQFAALADYFRAQGPVSVNEAINEAAGHLSLDDKWAIQDAVVTKLALSLADFLKGAFPAFGREEWLNRISGE